MTSSWTQIGSDIDAGNTTLLSGDGSLLVIGYPNENKGIIRTYKNIDGEFVQFGSDIENPNPNSNDFGSFLRLSRDGSTLASRDQVYVRKPYEDNYYEVAAEEFAKQKTKEMLWEK